MARLRFYVVFLFCLTVGLVSCRPRPDDDVSHTHIKIHVPHHIHKIHHTHVKKIYIPVHKKKEHIEEW